MKKVKAFLFSLHRISGLVICLFFFMWFVTGLVLVYHPFPNIEKALEYEKMEALPSSLPDLNDIISRTNIPDKKIQGIKISQVQAQTLFSFRTKDTTITVCADSSQTVKPVTFETIQRTADKWINAPVVKVDTLYKRDQWIMYSRYVEEMPIYKFYFDDKEKHQLYISSKTGKAQQLTDAGQRFRSWMGAIPHKFYIPLIRKDTDIWIRTLTISGIIGLLAALTGIYAGISVLRKQYRNKKKLESPYRKHWYKWHHISGLFFGIFLLTWAFSGAISMNKIPQWLVKTHGDYRVTPSQLRGKRLPLSNYVPDYRRIKEFYPDVKEIEFSHYQDIPVFNIIAGNREVSIDASGSSIKELFLPQNQIEKSIYAVHDSSASFTINLINEYETYYLGRKDKLPLPVYKVSINNPDKSLYYINPATGDFKYLNKSRKLKIWLFNALHYLQIKGLYEKTTLWKTVMWVLCTGGALVSLTGIRLSVRFIRRKLKRNMKQCNI